MAPLSKWGYMNAETGSELSMSLDLIQWNGVGLIHLVFKYR